MGKRELVGAQVALQGRPDKVISKWLLNRIENTSVWLYFFIKFECRISTAIVAFGAKFSSFNVGKMNVYHIIVFKTWLPEEEEKQEKMKSETFLHELSYKRWLRSGVLSLLRRNDGSVLLFGHPAFVSYL